MASTVSISRCITVVFFPVTCKLQACYHIAKNILETLQNVASFFDQGVGVASILVMKCMTGEFLVC